MPDQLKPAQPPSHAQTLRDEAGKRLSRSPHPYHRQQFELPYASEKLNTNTSQLPLKSAQSTDDEDLDSPRRLPEESREYLNSDSGTEADDEHFLKGLPAPKLRPHKGLRGADGSLSSSPSPILSPMLCEGDKKATQRTLKHTSTALDKNEARKIAERFQQKRRVEVVRRAAEAGILLFVGGILCLNFKVRELLWLWKRGKFYPILYNCH
jgi:hypothetical protein